MSPTDRRIGFGGGGIVTATIDGGPERGGCDGRTGAGGGTEPELRVIAGGAFEGVGGIGGGTGGTQADVPMGYGAGGSVYLVGKPGGPGKGTYGWGGAAGTIAWVDPTRHVRGTVMVNYFPAERWPLRRDVPAALARDFANIPR